MILVTPPPLKPSEPGLSGPAAATLLGRLGAPTRAIDASIGWHRFVLAPDRLTAALSRASGSKSPAELASLRRAVRHLGERPVELSRAATYADRRRYTSAIDHLETGLALVAGDFPDISLGIARIATSRRLESTATLLDLASRPGPFDDYFEDELIPTLAAAEPAAIGVSLTFQEQAPAAFRLARLLADRLPAVERVLAGPLVACWIAVGVELGRPPFDLFHRVVAGDDADLAALAGSSVAAVAEARAAGPLAPVLDDCAWSDYLAPSPVVPAALGRGCYWRRCSFCPDYLHPRHAPCRADTLAGWLRQVAVRFPDGAMLHLTDSALPPAHLAEVAAVIADERLPLRWHGFVRVEPEFADPDFAARLAAGGCAMLQFGVETGSPRLAERMGKGADPDLARAVLAATAAAGIKNHVYLLFGLPGEDDDDRELTLGLVEELGDAIHAVNPALLNLPRRSPMHRRPERYGITELHGFGADTDLSLYDDFRCGNSHPRLEARRWLGRRFFKSPRVRAMNGHLRSPFKANHLCFL